MRARMLMVGVALAAVAALPSQAGAAVSFNFATADADTVYVTTTEKLLAADTDNFTDTYSVVGGTLSLVSAPGTGAAGPAADAFGGNGVSADGSTFIFTTGERLVAADTDSSVDVYSRSGGTTSLVSAAGAGASGPSLGATFRRLSADGSTVVFETAESLVAADGDSLNDVYQRAGGTTTLVSAPGVGSSGSPQVMAFTGASADASRIFFNTTENLVAADTDGLLDTYERSGSTTTLVTAPGIGASGPAAASSVNRVSSDGTRAYFSSFENLVAADTDGIRDVYERSGGTTTLVSEPGVGASGPAEDSIFGGVSDDGSRVLFESVENLVAADTDGETDIYERSAGTTTLVSAPGVGASGPAFSAAFLGNSGDASIALFESGENLVTADVDGLDDVYQRSAGSTSLLSVEGLGASGPFATANFSAATPDASTVFFDTNQNMVAADFDGLQDVYAASGGGIALVSVPGAGAAGPPSGSSYRAASSDGGRVIIQTLERLTAADLDGELDLYERSGGVTTLISGEPGPPFGAPPVTALNGSAPPFTFSSDEAGSVFECSLDSAPFAPCTSPQSPSGLSVGGHTFAVRAIDPVGNVDPTPATASFTVDPPAVPAPKKCKKGQKLKKGKCVKKKRKKR